MKVIVLFCILVWAQSSFAGGAGRGHGSSPQAGGMHVRQMQAGLYQQLGLKEGDVIKSLNGKPVDSPKAAMDMYQTIKSSDQVVVVFERDGKEQTKTVKMK